MCGIPEVFLFSFKLSSFLKCKFALLRFFFLQVRAIVASKLEVWLPNPKLKNCAKELLMAVCVNCSSNTQRDIDVVSSIVKIRLKWKDLSGFYLACIRWSFFFHYFDIFLKMCPNLTEIRNVEKKTSISRIRFYLTWILWKVKNNFFLVFIYEYKLFS